MSTPRNWLGISPRSWLINSDTPQISPPDQNEISRARVIDEILARPNRKRRHRSYPRVIKRYGPCYRPIKRPHHHQTIYTGRTTVEITAA